MYKSLFSKRISSWFISAALILLSMVLPVCRADIVVTELEAKRAATNTTVPEYPAMARQLKITGKVVLEIVIGVDGTVEDVKVTSGNPMLTKSCVKAIHDWRFKPFLEDGNPTRAKTPMTFEFK